VFNVATEHDRAHFTACTTTTTILCVTTLQSETPYALPTVARTPMQHYYLAVTV